MFNQQFALINQVQLASVQGQQAALRGPDESPQTARATCACEFFGLGQQCSVPTGGVSSVGENGTIDIGAGDTVGTIAVVGGLGALALWVAGVL